MGCKMISGVIVYPCSFSCFLLNFMYDEADVVVVKGKVVVGLKVNNLPSGGPWT